MTFAHHSLFKQVLCSCNSAGFLSKIHSHLIVNGLIREHHLTIQTISLYLSFYLPKLAISVYSSIPRPTLQLQNLVIRCFSDHGLHSHLLSLYRRLQNRGSHRSDNFTFPFVIKACAGLASLRTGKEVHCAVLRTGYCRNVVVQTALVDMYAKTGIMGWSRKVFDEIPERDLVSWNALIAGYALNGLEEEAFLAFLTMQAADGLRPNASTFVSVIDVGRPGIRKSLHGFALKSGIIHDEAVVSALITMYAGIRDLAAARDLFNMIKSKDLVSWNTMISAYSQNGEPGDAFEIFLLMHHKGLRPNLVTMVSVLQSCGDLSSTHCGEMVHAIAIRLSLSDLISVATSLVSMYAKLGKLNAAESLFHEMPEKHLLLYNSMVSAYLQNGLPEMGLATFRGMQLEGLIPNSISIISAVSGCSACKDLILGKSLHAYSLRKGLESNISVMNSLLSLYIDCDQFADTHKLFHGMRSRNVISCNTLISGWAKIGDMNASLTSFCLMQQEVGFDSITMISILPSFHRPEDLYSGMSFHGLAIKSGFESDVSLKNALITMYTNFGIVDAADLLFESLSLRRTIVSWNALMTGYRNCSLFRNVMTLFDQMKREGHKPNSVTLLNLLPSCETKLQGKSVHDFAIRNFIELESSVLTSTMCMYARFEDFSTCRHIFEMMDKENVVSWNAVMSIYAESKDTGRALTSFKEMLGIRVEPDTVTMRALASACSQTGNLVLAQSVTGFAIRKGFDKNTAAINALIDMNAQCGSSLFARELFDRLESKDSVTWSVMISAYGVHGDGEAALRLFYMMLEAGVQPDDITFVSILSACSHSGLVEQGRIVFESMAKEHGIRPKAKHLACVVDLLGRAGHLDEAYEIVRKMSYDDKPRTEMLESLLGACRSHGDARVGEAIGKLALESCPSGASSHVMLSNIYAMGQRWMDSGRLRRDMGGRGLKKDPGFSLVQ